MKTNVLIKSLESLGLSPLQVKIYLNLLERPSQNMTNLAISLNISRVSLYKNIQQIESANLFKTSNGKGLIIEPPNKIVALLKRKQSSYAKISEELQDFLPELISTYYSNRKNSVVKFYQGRSEFITLLDQILEEATEEILFLGSSESYIQLIGWEYFNDWISRRCSKGIRSRDLIFKFNEYIEVKKSDLDCLRETKWLHDKYDCETSMFIYNCKVVFWNPALIRAIIIEDKMIYQLHLNNFDLLWQSNQSFD